MSVEDYISGQPITRRRMFQFVRNMFMHSAPGMSEKISYGIPFFMRYANVAYLNPTERGLDVGFTGGRHLSDEHPRLEVRDRKIVRSVMLAWDESPASVEEVLIPVIQEALLVDEWRQEQGRNRKSAKKRKR